MTTIAVLPTAGPSAGFRAVTGGREGVGPTPGQALDALVAQTGPPAGAAVILLQPPGGDAFFSDAERTRLANLMARWRAARDAGTPFPPADQAELDALTAAELRAATARSAALLRAVCP
jgi:hypothetical protein